MKKVINLLTLAIITLTLSACVQVTPEVKQNINQLAISSVRDSPLIYPQNSVFSLSPKYVKETSLKGKETQDVYQVFTHSIVENLQQNGFDLANTTQQSDFFVGFGVALSTDLSDEKINKKFGVSPGLPEKEDLDKGSFLIYIEDANTGQRVWRGIAQGFKHDGASTEQKKERAKAIVNSVMKQFYQTN